MTAKQRQDGHAVSLNRVARLIKAAGLRAFYSKYFVRTTVRGAIAHGIQDLVKREFSVSVLDKLWLSDMSYLRSLDGFLYLAMSRMGAVVASWAGPCRKTAGQSDG